MSHTGRWYWNIALCTAFLLFCLKTINAEPIDSRAFGILAPGMTTQALVQKFGPPDRIVIHPRMMTGSVRRGSIHLTEVEWATWFYTDRAGQIMETILTIKNGILVAKEKRH